MISLIPTLTSNIGNEATVSQVVDHIIYTGSMIGYDHGGIGSDFDGMPKTVAGLEDVSKFPVLVAEMLRRAMNLSDVEKIIGKNVIRVFKQVEREGKRLRDTKGVKILEDEVKALWEPELLEWCRKQWPKAQH
jgi:membrane dipeptidase